MDMEKLHFHGLTPYEKAEVERSLKREITGIWNSEMIRRTKPTPVDEAKSGLAVVEQVMRRHARPRRRQWLRLIFS